ncbi:MAG: hypothetical protein FD189_2538 [Elusimicrobia bacterium]|nr:MAG: hypothetical protein FD154_2349 [Elusimicrobiota bacterium]KAF0151842.1 MAG: hypothetical protein FD189_2538 [Elusimicrobiota bacterium]
MERFYAGRRVALLTQHGKELVIAPALNAALGCVVERVGGLDTDQFGSFTREIPRAGSQLDAARGKARAGMRLSGLPLGLASEGSFGPDPFTGMLPWNLELLLFIDELRGIEIAGSAQRPARSASLSTGSWTEARKFASGAGFPGHRLVLRPRDEHDTRVRKGLGDWAGLKDAFDGALAEADNGLVFLENDLRAHMHPSRRVTIRLAARDLARRIRSLCPACGLPGFWLVERLPGLPCAACGAPTREPRAEVYGCVKCPQRETRRLAGRRAAGPARCDYCNP